MYRSSVNVMFRGITTRNTIDNTSFFEAGERVFGPGENYWPNSLRLIIKTMKKLRSYVISEVRYLAIMKVRLL